jgi:hypothetical protein
MPLKLIVIYAAYGDALLLETPDQSQSFLLLHLHRCSHLIPEYWLIDGGPINPTPTTQIRDDEIPLVAYYQYLKRALYRYKTPSGNRAINSLSGIIVTHPDGDHIDGLAILFSFYHPLTLPAQVSTVSYETISLYLLAISQDLSF